MSERTRGPIERVESSRGKRSTRLRSNPHCLASGSVSVSHRRRFASLLARDFPRVRPSCTSSHAPEWSREINEPATHRQPRPGHVRVNRGRAKPP